MKRYSWIAALLVVALAFVLFGCGGEDPAVDYELTTKGLLVTAVASWGAGLDIQAASLDDGSQITVEGIFLSSSDGVLRLQSAGGSYEYFRDSNKEYQAGEKFTYKYKVDTSNATPPAQNPDVVSSGLRIRGESTSKYILTQVLVKDFFGDEVVNLAKAIADKDAGPVEGGIDKLVKGTQGGGGDNDVSFRIVDPNKAEAE